MNSVKRETLEPSRKLFCALDEKNMLQSNNRDRYLAYDNTQDSKQNNVEKTLPRIKYNDVEEQTKSGENWSRCLLLDDFVPTVATSQIVKKFHANSSAGNSEIDEPLQKSNKLCSSPKNKVPSRHKLSHKKHHRNRNKKNTLGHVNREYETTSHDTLSESSLCLQQTLNNTCKQTSNPVKCSVSEPVKLSSFSHSLEEVQNKFNISPCYVLLSPCCDLPDKSLNIGSSSVQRNDAQRFYGNNTHVLDGSQNGAANRNSGGAQRCSLKDCKDDVGTDERQPEIDSMEIDPSDSNLSDSSDVLDTTHLANSMSVNKFYSRSSSYFTNCKPKALSSPDSVSSSGCNASLWHDIISVSSDSASSSGRNSHDIISLSSDTASLASESASPSDDTASLLPVAASLSSDTALPQYTTAADADRGIPAIRSGLRIYQNKLQASRTKYLDGKFGNSQLMQKRSVAGKIRTLQSCSYVKNSMQQNGTFGTNSGTIFDLNSGPEFGTNSGTKFGASSDTKFGANNSTEFDTNSGTKFGINNDTKFGTHNGTQFDTNSDTKKEKFASASQPRFLVSPCFVLLERICIPNNLKIDCTPRNEVILLHLQDASCDPNCTLYCCMTKYSQKLRKNPQQRDLYNPSWNILSSPRKTGRRKGPLLKQKKFKKKRTKKSKIKQFRKSLEYINQRFLNQNALSWLLNSELS